MLFDSNCYYCCCYIGSVICYNRNCIIKFKKKAYIPVVTNNCSIVDINSSSSDIYTFSSCNVSSTEFSIQVSFVIYIIALMSFISWFLFVLFGGIGLFALPLDLLYDFCTRPKKLNSTQLEKMKKQIIDDGLMLRELANETRSMEERGVTKKNSNNCLNVVFNKEKRTYNTNLNKLRAGATLLDNVHLF